jgi:site-specific DNA-methyltransferase (adenine-specific)
MSLPLNTVLHGLCLDLLKPFPDNSIDSIVTDVPYGLGEEPTLEQILEYLQGADLITGEFKGKDWTIPSVPTWKECFRVLKPGGYLLSFAGTRTMDLISMGIRAAGFENRDCIDSEMGPPVLRWLRAQGMPKSVDISKELKKRIGKNQKKKGSTEEDLPITPEVADLWSGYGTALRPTWEPILVFRKPLQKNLTLLGQVLSTGTGAINIDGCRVKHSSPEDFEKHKAQVDAIKAKGGKRGNSWKNSSDLSGANDVSTAGRFPPNVIMVHSDLCVKVGMTTASLPPLNRFDDGAKPFGGGAGHEYHTIEREDEQVTVWECHPSCPIHHLKKQHSEAHKYFYGVDPESHLFYVPKPSLAEKSQGLGAGEDNLHVSVKPIRLMEYLVRLATPKGGVVLDPYCGSGTTLVAASNEGLNFIGIDKEEPSVKTALARTKLALASRQEREDQKENYDLMLNLESI